MQLDTKRRIQGNLCIQLGHKFLYAINKVAKFGGLCFI